MQINPALKELEFLAGKWSMELSNAAFLSKPDGKMHGDIDFERIEHGAWLVMHQGVEAGKPPAATWLIGRNDAGTNYTVFYMDQRPVPRIYEMSFENDV